MGPEAVNGILDMTEAIGLIEDMFRKGSNELDLQPSRTITRPSSDSVILTMPTYSPSLRRYAVKVVTEFKNNPERYGLPVQGGRILLIDCEDSRTLAIIDSPSVTAIRTGAMGGLAARILSKSESYRVGVIGSGSQAKAHLEAVCAVREVGEVKVASRNAAHAKSFAHEMSKRIGVPIEEVGTPREAVSGSDIAIAATSSATPVLESADVPDGCHVNSVGALPDKREISSDLIARASVFVDTRKGVLSEAGDVMQAIREGRFSPSSVKADLSELVLSAKPGRTGQDEVTLFKSVGFGLLDVYTASYIYDKATKLRAEGEGFPVKGIQLI